MIEIDTKPRDAVDLTPLLVELSENPYIGQFTQMDADDFVEQGTIRFFYLGDDLVGFGAWELLSPNWVEVGPFYTADAFRGQGYGKQIVAHIIQETRQFNRYGVTKNDAMRGLFKKQSFREVGFWSLPRPVKLHLVGRLRPTRIVRLARKFSLDRVTHHIKRARR